MIYEIDNLTFSYPGSERKVLDGVSLNLNQGEILCILGPNGAGKTTLLNCMAGLLKGQSGNIQLCGQDLEKMGPKEIANVIGYVPQIHTPAFDYSVRDFVLMGRAPKISMYGRPSKKDMDICEAVMKDMGIDHLADKSYLNISGGERQQALIARAVVQEPEAILFDEPTAHLDFGNQHRVLHRIEKMASNGFAVVITTHNPDHALMLGSKAAIISRDGKIVQGDCEEIVTEENLRKIYDVDVRIKWIEELGKKICIVPEGETIE